MILAFTDCETTHLSPDFGQVWEVAVIRREHNGTQSEHLWQFAPDRLDITHAEALKVGRFVERYVVPEGADAVVMNPADGAAVPVTRRAAVSALADVLLSAVLVGSNPGFDDRHLRKLLDLRDEQPWHYRPVCIANLAEGYLWATQPHTLIDNPFPRSSTWLSRMVGVEPPTADTAHTALGDARWAMAVHDAITGGLRPGAEAVNA